jgi:hypothetical protein
VWFGPTRSTSSVSRRPTTLTKWAGWWDVNTALYARVKAAGGILYPVSALRMSKGDSRDHFGSAFAQLDAAKDQYDPGTALTPGYAIF